jgi:hypothetical protein
MASPISTASPAPVWRRLGDVRNGAAIFCGILCVRLVNALTISTFFQPDEYFQVLEPAWSIALASREGEAWLTWVGNLKLLTLNSIDQPWILTLSLHDLSLTVMCEGHV